MSHGINYLHSHSGIERDVRDLANDKFHVLIDEEFKHMFDDCGVKLSPYMYMGVKYYKVPTYTFFRKGGVFKNLNR
jgi:hypothetical protein